MNAIILAAGMGRRISRAVNNLPKCLLEVDGIPLIEHALHALRRNHVRKCIIGIGYRADTIKQKLQTIECHDIIIQYVHNQVYHLTNNIYTLALCSRYVGGNVLLIEGDVWFEHEILNELLRDPFPNVAVVSPYRKEMDGTVVSLGKNCFIDRIIPKCDQHEGLELSGYYKTINLYKFRHDFFRFTLVPEVERCIRKYGAGIFYEYALRNIVPSNPRLLKAQIVSEAGWHEIDTIDDLHVTEHKCRKRLYRATQ